MAVTILSNALFMDAILPFLLIFAVVFAILQKTKVLGEDKKAIDAVVAFVVGLITIAFGNATNMITNLIPFLGVSIVVILIFLMLWGFVWTGKEPFEVPKGVRWAFGIAIAIAVFVAVLVVTGNWDWFIGLFTGTTSSDFVGNIVLIAVVIIAVAVVIGFGGKKEEKKS